MVTFQWSVELSSERFPILFLTHGPEIQVSLDRFWHWPEVHLILGFP